ncbi:YSIRK-type signal peptide-containing protein, partial [Streptococcus suis]|nr:YSIRK-type signal peptide-containing protein [Streptococcus suis]
MHKFKRKKLNRQEAFNFEKRSQFSIRKLTIGVVSLAIGISTVLTDAPIVEAGTDYTPGVDIRYARNGSPKDLSTQKDFDITTTPYYDSATKKHYVDVTLTFNNEGTSYSNITFLAFNIPDSLYDPQQITRETYLNNGATQVLYQTDKFSAWEWADPADAGTSHWNTPAVWMDARFVAGRPDLLTDNGQSHVKWISATQKTAWAGWQYNGDKWQGDWGRLLETFNTSGDGAAAEIAVHRDFKDKSRTFYINKLPASSNKVVYKFRSEVKDGNKPMNFIYGMNAQIANGYANFYAKYGTTPDIRTMAEKYEPKLPSRTQVDDLGQITNEQKQQKTQAIKEANPDVKDSIKEIKYPTGDTGKVEIIYTDDAKDSYDLSAFFYPKPATTQGGTGTFTSTQTSLSYNSSDHTAETENGNRNKVIFSPNEQTKNTMHRIQLPDKVEVPDASNIEESKWNQQLNALKIKNNLKRSNDGGRSGTLAKGTVIFGYGSRYDNDVATDDMVVASETDARLKREGNKIVGIEVLGKNQSGQTGQVAGVITADMLFKKAEAKTDLTPLKESAKTEIDKLILEPEDKQNFKNAVQDAQDANAIEQALTNAKNKADELKQKKATAKAEIDKFANLTEEEKTQFKQGIDDLTTTNAIDGKVAEAKAQDLNKFKETAKEKLKDFTNLTPDQKTQYTNEIANADSADAIKTALDKAAFDDIKTKAVADINGMDPAPANKEDLLNQINAITKDTSVSDSKTPAEQIKSIVDKAKADAAKDAVKRTIDAIQGLTDPQKQDYKNEIDVATTEGDINNIIQDAQAQPKKNDTKNKISALTNLNNAQKDDLKAAVDNSNSVEELDGILATAYNLDADMKHLKDLVAQAEETKNSNLYTSVTQDKQTALDNAIVAAKKVTEQNTLGNVPTLTNDLTLALKGLNASPVTKDLDKKGLEQAIADAEAAKNDANPLYKYASEDKKQAFEQDLAAAKVAKENTSSKQTQADVDNALTNLITAKAGLNGKAPVKVQDVTPPLLVDAELNAKYSEVAFHGMSTVGRKVARPRTSTTEDLYGKDTTGLVELKVTNDGSPVDLTSVQFDDDSQAKLRTLGLQYVPYTEDEAQTRTNNAIGYFTTIEEAGVVKDTGTEIVELKFSLANKDGVRSSLQTFKYLVKDDIAPTADVTEHILIKGEVYTIDVPIQDNSLFGTEGGVSKGTISIKPTDNSGPLTPSILGVTNGTTANAFTITPTKPTQFILGNDNRGQRSNTGKVSFSGTPTETLEQTTYKFRLGDDNKLRNSPENVSLTDITFTVVDRLVAPAESAKVSVNNASSLTDTEKNAIKQAVKDANPHIAVIDGYAGNDASKQVRIDVTNTGQVTVTYPHGGKTDTLTADQVLKANEGPVFGTSDLLPTRWVTGANIQRHELPTLLVFSGPEKNQPAPAFPTDRQSLTVEQVTNNKFGRMPFTDPEGDALTFESIKTLSNGTIGINVAPNGTLHGNGIGNYGPGASWIVNLTATDSKGKATKSSDFRVVGYTDKVADPNQAVAGTYGQAVEEAQIFEKLTIDATSAYADNFKKTNDPNYKFEVPADQYTRTITGHSTTNDGQNVTTVNNGAAGLPTQGTYFAEVTTTNVWGQVIKNYVKVVYPELTTTIDPQAPTSPVTLQGETVQESEKPRIIQALKDANPNITFPERTDFQVAGDGTVTIVYPDQSRDTVRVPIKQQDSAKYTPTVTETPINSVTTPGTPLTEEERNAVKAAVRVTNFPEGGQQPTVTVPENAQVTTGTSGNTGKQVVVVTVNYPDGSSENVEVPVKQRDNAKYEATVSNPDTPAAIKASHALGTAITDQADKAAILAKVTVPAGSNGQPTLDQTPVVEIHDGKPAVKVTVTYPDQTADTVYVPVDQKDNEATEPTVTEPNKPALISQPATAATTLDKLTEEDKTAIKDKVEVPGLSGQDAPRKEVVSGVKDGSGQNADKKVVEVEVTYKDGTKDKVEVPVAQKDSAQYDATAKETPVALDTLLTSDQPLSAEDREALKAGVNVPEGSNGEIHVPEDAKVKQVAGKPVVEAEVHYPDGTVDKVQVPVRQSDRAVYTPNLVESKEVPISVDPAGNPSITSPDDAAILANVDVPAATQDGTKPQVTKTIASAVKDGTGANQGKKVVAVEITYPDQSKEMIEVPVKHADNQVHNPTAPTAAVKVDAPVTPDSPLSADDKKAIKDAVTIPDGSNGVASLPEDAKVVDRNGTPVVPVTVTYPDKTTDTVYVPVVQKDSAKHTPSLTNADSPVLIDTPAKTNEPVQEVDKTAIAGKVDKTNLPQDTEVKVPDNAVVEIVDGKPVVPVEINYPDGTSETIKVPIDQKDDLTYTPVAPSKDKPVAITASQTPGTQITDPADTKAILDSVTVPAVDGKEAGEVDKEIVSAVQDSPDGPYVTVKVTYPDGTSETVQVPVNQKDNETYNPTTPTAPVQVDAPAEENAALSDADKQAIKSAVQIPDGSNGVASLPEDAKVELVDGKPVVPVTVTYPDNTTDTVYVPVVQKDSAKHTASLINADSPVLTDTPAKADTPVQEADKTAIAGKVDLSKLPANTTATVPEGAKVELENGKPVVPVTVNYPDGTSEIIKVPIDQKDSETYTPTGPATDAPIAITGSDAPDTPIAEADKSAILNSVTVPAVDGGQAPEVRKEITSPVKLVEGNPVVEVTVTYPDNTPEVINVPVNQKDNEANNPTVTAPEKPAPISVPVAADTPVVTEADKNLIIAKVNVDGLPNPPQSVKVAEPAKVILDEAGTPVVNVEVTYPDGTKDIVPVPVKQADNQTNNPSLKEQELGKPAEVLVSVNPTPGTALTEQADKDAVVAKVDLSKLPAGTTAKVADDAVVAVDPLTNKPVIPVTVTYPDGTSETINVPVKQADNLANDPSLRDTNSVPVLTEAAVGLSVSDKADKEAIEAKVDLSKLPEGTKATVDNPTIVAGKEDGPHAGQPVVNVLVTYLDGTQDTVEVPVKQADNVVKEPGLKDQTSVPIQAAAATGTVVPEADKQAILAKVEVPEGAKATIADDAKVVRENGEPVVPVTVTYPDGTQDTIHVPVKRADNSKYTPEQVTESVQVDATVTDGSPITSQVDKDAIIASVKVPTVAQGDQAPTVTLPANPTVKVKEDQPVVEATITYADGTTDTVDVPVVQKESAQKEPSLKKAEDGNPEKAIVSVEPKAGTSITEQADKDAILDKVLAPEGATASLGQSPTVIVVEDQPYVPVFVTYGDGSVDTINVPVKQADNQAYEPSLKTSAVTLTDIPRVGDKVEEEADLVAIKDAVETNGGTATIDNPVIVETADGQPAVEVVVTYEDGTKDTIQVPVRSGDNRLYTPSLKSESPVLISVSTEEGTALPGADQAKILANIDVPGINGGEKPEVELTIANPNVEHKNGKAGVTGTVTYKDGTTDTIFVPVATDTDKDGFSDQEEDGKGSDKNNPADVPSGETSAQRLDPIVKEAVPVSDPAKLTDTEKEAIKEEVKTSNDLPAGTEITVSDNGTVTVTYPDQSTDTIPANTTVTAKDTDGDGFSDKDEAAGSDINDKASTPETLDDDKDGFTNKEETAAGTDAKDPASTPAGQDTAGRLTPAVESPVQVTDPAKLTDEEKEAVKKAVEDSNNLPAGTEIKVSDDGTVTVTYPDKSTDTIKPSETVKATETEAPSKPAIATTEKGDVLITPPAENVTNLDITFTPEGSAQPITVTVTKGEDGKWTAPADSGLVVNPDGSITIPADRVKDGSAVSVVAKNGDSLAIEVATTVVPTASTNADEKPVAPTKPGVTVTPEGEVLITPPAENVTSLDITFTPEGSTQPITVTVTKDEAGTWTAPAGSGLVVNQDGTITIPADIAKDGSSVSVVAKNGDLASDQVGSTVVPVQSTEVPVIPSKPTVTANGDGSVTVTPPAENVTSLDITFIPEGSDTPVRVPITKGEDGTWIAPADSSLVVNPDGSITIPADKIKDGTEGQVTAVAKNDQATSEDTPETPAVAPLAPTVETATDGSVRITPPTENVTSLDITFTPEGSDQPVTVTVTKDAAGNWTAPADSGLVVNSDGSITIPADRVKDGSVVSVVAKNGEVPSAEAGASYVPSTSTAVTPETPVAPAVPTVSVDSNGNVLIIPPADGATSIDITFTPKDNAQPITVSITKGEDGKWLAPEGSIPVVNPDGTITISVSEIESGTAVSVISKNGEVPSTEAGSVLIPKATISDRLTPSVASPVKVTDPAKLTNEEKEAVKKAVEGSNNLPAGTKVEVSDNGTVTVTYPDGSVDTILPTKTVMESQHGAGETHELPAYDLQADDDKDGFSNLDELLAGTDPTAPASTPAGQDTAGRLTPGLAEPVEVKNPAKLTDTEKEAIKEEVKTSNDLPAGTEITVSDNGTVTVT